MAVITAAAITVAGTVYASKQASKQQKAGIQAQKDAAAAADPYAAYRPDAALRLNKLMDDPSSIVDSAGYKARMQATERAMASQGYTGSGNALIAAADAGGTAYQEEFDRLAKLSGADTGLGNAASVNQTGMDINQRNAENKLSATAGMINGLTNLATTVGSRFNKPAATGGGG